MWQSLQSVGVLSLPWLQLNLNGCGAWLARRLLRSLSCFKWLHFQTCDPQNPFIIHLSAICICSWACLAFNLKRPLQGEESSWLGEHRYGDKFQSITFAFKSGINEMDHPGLHLTPLVTAASVFIWNNDRRVWGQPTSLFSNYLLGSCFDFMSSPLFIHFPPPLLQCNNDYAPVCGSNNQNYQNECFLRRDACKQQSEVLIMSEGACPAGKYFPVPIPKHTHARALTCWGNHEHGEAHSPRVLGSKREDVSKNYFWDRVK